MDKSRINRTPKGIVKNKINNRLYLTAAFFLIAILVLNNLRLSAALNDMTKKEKETTQLKNELESELLLVNYVLSTPFDISHARDYIQYDSPDIRKLAFELKKPENMYYFVLENISYTSAPKTMYATEVLNITKGDCAAKSNLLASVLRAGGHPPENVKVVAGVVYTNKEENKTIFHNWVEFYDHTKNKWFVFDTTPVLDVAPYEKYTKRDFYLKYVQDVFFEYNDGYYTLSHPMAEEEVIS